MGKKKRKTAISGKGKEEERGFRVVDEDGKPVYYPVHPDGVSETQAHSLAANHIMPVRVVRITPEP